MTPAQDYRPQGKCVKVENYAKVNRELAQAMQHLAAAKEALAACMFGLEVGSTSFEKQSAWEQAKTVLNAINEK